MFVCMPSVIGQSGSEFSVQSVETADEYILIRVRTDEMITSGHHETQVPAVVREQFTLGDERGTAVPLFKTVSAGGGGPFAGIVDFAFPMVLEIDLSSPLTLAFENA